MSAPKTSEDLFPLQFRYAYASMAEFYLELGITHLIPKVDLKPLPLWDLQSLELQMKHSHQSQVRTSSFSFQTFETACSALHERPLLPI